MDDLSQLPFKQKRQTLIDSKELIGLDFCHTWTDEVDKEIQLLYFQLSDEDAANLAIVAVGSYGRRELCPYSDIDFTIVYDKKKNINEIVDKLLYPMWDLGIKIDHSVRTLKDASKVLQSDLKAAMGLLDARLVAGKFDYLQKLKSMTLDAWQKLASTYIPELINLTNEREFKFGDLAYLLEPDLKESHGGIRDLTVIDCYNLAFNQNNPQNNNLIEAKSLLIKTRVELHRNLNRYSDKFALQEQDKVAKSLGYSDTDNLMKEISAAGEAVSMFLNDLQYHTSALHLSKNSSKLELPEPTDTAVRYILQDGYLNIEGECNFRNSEMPFRLAIIAAINRVRIDPDLLTKISQNFTVEFPIKPKIRDEFLKLLSLGSDALDAILTLEYHGIVSQILPYWDSIKNKPQRNAYHRYTVNRHLIQAALNASKLVRHVDRPDLLIFGSLFHDIGKGFPGDHTEVGIQLMDEIGRKLGFNTSDIKTLQQMIRFHLLLPDLATRRDIEDITTVQNVVDAVQTEDLLGLLVGLTEADSLATGPAAWGTWKQQLVYELAARARTHMAGKVYLMPASDTIFQKYKEQINTDSNLEVLFRDGELVIMAQDSPGLFAILCGVISLNNFEILKANAVSLTNSKVLDIFIVQSKYGRELNVDHFKDQINDFILNTKELETQIKEKESNFKIPKNKLTALEIEPSITVDNAASTTATVIEVRSADKLGLLYKIAHVISKYSLDIKSALISTIGLEAIDVFYVTDTENNKINDIAFADILSKELEDAL